VASGSDLDAEDGVIHELDDDAAGRWRITTRTGTRYLLDMDRRLIRQQPVHGGGSTPMRADGWDVALLEVAQCRVGLPLVVLIDLQLPGAACTRRIAADITRIRLARAGAPS